MGGLVEAAHLKPAAGFLTGWDATYLVLDALRHVRLNATAADLRAISRGVTGWSGVNGVYDFRHIPQRGVGSDYLFMLDWTRATNSFSVVSSAGGAPKR